MFKRRSLEEHVERQAQEVEWLLAGVRRPSLPEEKGGEGMLMLMQRLRTRGCSPSAPGWCRSLDGGAFTCLEYSQPLLLCVMR